MKTTKNKYADLLVFLCASIYFVSYITRINYAAVLVEIIKDLDISKTSASFAITASAVSYGFGQLISGRLGDKFKPNKIIMFGLVCTATMNLLISVVSASKYMTVIWFVNGFAQAMMWPPLSKILVSMLSTDGYKKGSVNVSCASSVATIFMYVAAPFIIYVSNWRVVFIFSALCAVLMCVVWKIGFEKIERNLGFSAKSNTVENIKTKKFTPKVIFLLCAILLSIIIQGSLRDGVSTWMPSYISETFNLGSEISILTNVLLPVFSVFTYNIVSLLNRKLIHNEYLCVTVIYATGAVSAFILAVFGSSGAAVAVIAAAILNASMHGVNYCQTALTPIYFLPYGKVSFIAGLLNSGTYVGSAISTYGIAMLTKSLAWEHIAGIWFVTSFVGTILCLCISKPWHKFKNT